ncbi:hypothetical protein HC174_10250 [Salinimicrobium sp. CDJ15-81-2]|nr:hypothetical protein [Salinimicrobium nanhaiense]
MPPIKYLFKAAFLILFIMLNSCVKDVDLDQAEEIVIPPTAAIDLIYFDLTEDQFFVGPGGNLRAVDETRLDFLDDDYIQDGLMRADFNFRFINSFESPFDINILFKSPSNAIRHQIRIEVPAGTVGTPAVIDYTEIIDNSQIDRIRKSIKVSVEVDMQENPAATGGSLQLKSKGTYYFEFK